MHTGQPPAIQARIRTGQLHAAGATSQPKTGLAIRAAAVPMLTPSEAVTACRCDHDFHPDRASFSVVVRCARRDVPMFPLSPIAADLPSY